MNIATIMHQYSQDDVMRLAHAGYRRADFAALWDCDVTTVTNLFHSYWLELPKRYETDAFAVCCFRWGLNAAEFAQAVAYPELTPKTREFVVETLRDGTVLRFDGGSKRGLKHFINPVDMEYRLRYKIPLTAVQRTHPGYSKARIQQYCDAGQFKQLVSNNELSLHGLYRACRDEIRL